MTKQIKDVIENLTAYVEFGAYNEETIDDNIKMAIRSLNAWEEVLQELENFDEDEYLKDEGHRFGCNEGICYAIELINQKLKGVTE